MSGAEGRDLLLEGGVAFLEGGKLSGERECEECADFSGRCVARGEGFTVRAGLLFFGGSERKGVTRVLRSGRASSCGPLQSDGTIRRGQRRTVDGEERIRNHVASRLLSPQFSHLLRLHFLQDRR